MTTNEEITTCPECEGHGVQVYSCRFGYHPADPASTADEAECWACKGKGFVDIYEAEDLVRN